MIRAENTDAPGLLAALPASPAGKRALVLGAGGSARAAAWALAGRGSERRRLEPNRRARRRGSSATWRRSEVEGRIATVSAEEIEPVAYELIANCTSVGLAGEDPFEQLPIDPRRFDARPILVDLVYGGEETRLVREARRRGATVVDGLEVLVRQGGESLRIWTGLEPPLEAMREAARAG